MVYQFAPWSRNDKKRLYVKRDDTQLGYLDTTTLQQFPEKPAYATELARALATLAGGTSAAAGEVSGAAATPEVMVPWTDLAANPPGHTLSGTTNANYESGVIGEQRTAAMLHPLLSTGWKVAHAVPLAPAKDIDHLLVGPAGVIAVNSKHTTYPVTVDGSSIHVDGHRKPWAESIDRDAHLTGRYLSDALRMPVTVRPLLAIWAMMGLTGAHPYAVAGDQLAERLAALPTVYPPAWVEVVFATARRSDTWTARHHQPAA